MLRCQHVVQEPGQADQAHQQEQLPARAPPPLLHPLLLPQGPSLFSVPLVVL
jgi:hypothetical protein